MEIILTTTSVFILVASIFALLLTLANKTIGDYGIVKLIINKEKEYNVKGGSTLLSTLIEEKIFIPSACGGKGSCGYCKVEVHEGGGPVLQTELGLLTEEDLKNRLRLSCQCKVKEDIEIRIPEELFNIKEVEGKVLEIEKLTSVIKKLKIEIKDDFTFKPGQYIQLKAPKYEGNLEEVYRAYSIATSPSEKKFIELIIGYVKDGVATTYVHEHLKEGDRVKFNGPYGDFYYHESERDMIMVAVGTGIAPILSILKYMSENNIKRKVRFYFGAKTEKDLFMLDYFKELEGKLYNFKFIPCLSRADDKWKGFNGRVNNALEKYLDSAENNEAYLCGNEPMINSVVMALKEKGLAEELIYFDKFS